MKKSTTLKFTNACITKDDEGNFIITETAKDDLKVYNLSEKLEEFLDVEGISLQMGKVEDIPSEE